MKATVINALKSLLAISTTAKSTALEGKCNCTASPNANAG